MSFISDSNSLSNTVAERVAKQLEECTEELLRSLDEFTSEREKVAKQRKQALDAYEDAMMALEEESDYDEPDPRPVSPKVDHNIMRHLNVIKDGNLDDGEEYTDDNFEGDNEDWASYANTNSKTLKVPKIIPKEKVIIPTLEEKKNIRNVMFDLLDECKIAETRLEIEYDQAKDNDDMKKAEEIAEALFLLQRRNHEKLNSILDDYKPNPSGKVWGNDPDYSKMVRNLKAAVHQDSEAAFQARKDIFDKGHVQKMISSKKH